MHSKLKEIQIFRFFAVCLSPINQIQYNQSNIIARICIACLCPPVWVNSKCKPESIAGGGIMHLRMQIICTSCSKSNQMGIFSRHLHIYSSYQLMYTWSFSRYFNRIQSLWRSVHWVILKSKVLEMLAVPPITKQIELVSIDS